MKKNIIALLLGLFLSFIILELFLRTPYNPFPVRVEGKKIVLLVNQRYVYENNRIDKLDKKIIRTINSLGFRGEEPPKNLDNYLSIIVVGGSTAECGLLSDNKTWPYFLEQNLKKSYRKIWLNNAGLNGHSTFGHAILLREYLIKLKPKIILFLVGCNDIERDDLSPLDKRLLRGVYETWRDFIAENCEVVSLFANIVRTLDTRAQQLRHKNVDITKFNSLEIPEETIRMELQKHKTKYIEDYKKRLLQLIDISKKSGIEPIFITQPTLWGGGIDSLTGVNLETIKLSDSMNGKLNWEILGLYNNATKEISKTTDTFVIDLANKLPKNSLYFYDGYHYTNKGSEKASEILYRELKDYLDNKYKSFRKNY